ncbi:MAG: STAS domain-containing protein [Leptospirales bacterium]|nr:STAS domain-containing protein [Leptospirales bacterium]
MLTLAGKIQMGDTERLEKALDELVGGEERSFVIDLSGVAYICSSALGVLIAVKRRIARMNGEVRLIIRPGEVLDLFRLTMVDRVFPIHRSVEEAAQASTH